MSRFTTKAAVVVVAAVVACVLCLAAPAGATTYYAGSNGSDASNYTYQDSIASYILGSSGAGRIPQTDVDLANLISFGNGSSGDGNEAAYGTVNSNGASGGHSPGWQAARYIKSLYDYNYLTVFSGDNTVTAQDRSVTFAMFIPNLFVMVYQVCDSIVGIVFNIIQLINVPGWFGISLGSLGGGGQPVSPADVSAVPGGVTEATTEGAKGFIGAVSDMVGALVPEGVDRGAYLETILRALVIFWGFALCLTVIVALGTVKGRLNLKGARSWAMRIVTAIVCIPTAIMLTGLLNEVAATVGGMTASSVSASVDNCIVDTLDFAAATNLDLAVIDGGSSPASWSAGSWDTPNSRWMPTSSNVTKLNERIRSITGKDTGAADSDAAQADAVSKMFGLQQNVTANISTYASQVSSYIENGRPVAAARTPKAGDTVVPNVPGLANNTITIQSLRFLEERDAEVAANDGSTNTQRISNWSYSWDGGGNSYTVEGYDPNSGQVIVTDVAPKNLASYIYGLKAGGSNTEQSGSHYSYSALGAAIAGSQYINPKTGDTVSPSLNNGEAAENDAITANAVALAAMNRNAGIKDGSLSTQSVVLLLQSTLDNNSLHYNSYNTGNSDADAANQTGNNGNVFARYTIPHYEGGGGDGTETLTSKVAQLTVTWVAAGVVSLVALITFITSPLLGSIVNAVKGFCKGLFTGNIFGLFEYAVRLAALYFCYIFYSLAITAGCIMAGLVSGITGFMAGGIGSVGTSLGGAADSAAGIAIAGGFLADVVGAVSGFVSLVLAVVLALAVAVVVCWPIMPMTVNGQTKQLNIVAIVINIPLIVADRICESFGQWSQRLYGGAYGKNARGDGRSQRQHIAPIVGAAAGAAGAGALVAGATVAGAARGVAQGAAGGGASGAVRGMLSGAADSAAGAKGAAAGAAKTIASGVSGSVRNGSAASALTAASRGARAVMDGVERRNAESLAAAKAYLDREYPRADAPYGDGSDGPADADAFTEAAGADGSPADPRSEAEAAEPTGVAGDGFADGGTFVLDKDGNVVRDPGDRGAATATATVGSAAADGEPSADGEPADGRTADRKPAGGRTADRKPAGGKSAAPRPSDGSPGRDDGVPGGAPGTAAAGAGAKGARAAASEAFGRAKAKARGKVDYARVRSAAYNPANAAAEIRHRDELKGAVGDREREDAIGRIGSEDDRRRVRRRHEAARAKEEYRLDQGRVTGRMMGQARRDPDAPSGGAVARYAAVERKEKLANDRRVKRRRNIGKEDESSWRRRRKE